MPDEQTQTQTAVTEPDLGPADQATKDMLLKMENKPAEAPPAEAPPADAPPADKPADAPKDDIDALLEGDDSISKEVGGLNQAKNELNIEFSEESVLSEDLKQKFSDFIGNTEVDEDTFDNMSDLLEEATQEGYSTMREAILDEQKQRQELVNKDPLMNEANRPKTIKNLQATIQKFGGEDTKGLEAFFNSHYSLDPSLMRLMNNIGSALSENPELGSMKSAMNSGKTADAKQAESRKGYEILFNK